MVIETIDFELLSRNDRDSILNMINSITISDSYKSGLINAANWMFDDIVYFEVTTIDAGMKMLREAEQRILDARSGATGEDLDKAELLEKTMLNRLKHRLVRSIEGGCPDCLDL